MGVVIVTVIISWLEIAFFFVPFDILEVCEAMGFHSLNHLPYSTLVLYIRDHRD